MKGKCKRALIGLLAVVTVAAPLTISAAAAVTPYESYLYDSNGDMNYAPPGAQPDNVLEGPTMGTVALNGPQDLFVDKTHDTLYIVDTGNNRILKMDNQYQLIREYKEFSNPDYDPNAAAVTSSATTSSAAAADAEAADAEAEDTEAESGDSSEATETDSGSGGTSAEVPTTTASTTVIDAGMDSFAAPTGVWVDPVTEDILIADTGHQRLVRLDRDSNLVAIYKAPVSDLLPGDFNYQPIKVACDSAGRIFVCSRGFNRGLLELDANGNFVQMLGAPKPVYTLAESIQYLLSTEEQRARRESFVPSEYNNLMVDDEGFIYVTTNSNVKEPVRRVNAKGNDVLRRTSGKGPVADLIENTLSSIKGSSLVNDVTTLTNGMYAILDQRRGRVFVYNIDGGMQFMFGGLGNTRGTVTTPTSLVYFNDEFLVLDGSKNAILTFQLTEYGSLFFEAENCKANNDYEGEAAAWAALLDYNQENAMVLRELGNVAYRQREMKDAMDYFDLAWDKDNYSKAWKFYRRDVLNEHFMVVGIVAVVLVLALFAYIIFQATYRKKHPKPEKKKGPLAYCTYVSGRMLDGYWDLKRENRGSVKAAFILIGLTMLMMILKSQFTGFIFQSVRPIYANIFNDIFRIALPFVLWIVAQWCITSLMAGEGSFKDIFIATAYALTPLIILTPIATILSNVLSQDEGAIYTALIAISYIWLVLMLIASVMQTHNFTLGQTIGVILLTLLAIAIIVFVALLCLALVQQMIAFVTDIVEELANR